MGNRSRRSSSYPKAMPSGRCRDASLEHKFALFADPVLGEAQARKIVSLIDDLEHISNIRTLSAALRGEKT